jgi:hypothetical protein
LKHPEPQQGNGFRLIQRLTKQNGGDKNEK